MIRLSRHARPSWIAVVTCALTLTAAAGAAQEPPARKLTVAVVEDAPPFSYQAEDGAWRGIAVELWHFVADQLHVEYELRGMDRTQLYDRVAEGAVDLGIGPLTMSAEAVGRVEFSAPYYVTGLAIAVPEKRSRVMVLLDNAISPTFLELVGALLVMLLLVGAAFWMFERHKNPEFGGPHVHGVGSGLWLAVVTMSTVGYGDKSPKTLGGRTIAAVWMLASLLLIATFTGTVASLLTADRWTSTISRPEDFHRVRVVTVAETGAAILLQDQNLPARQVASVDEAVQELIAGTADAVALDRSLLKYHLTTHPTLPITIMPGTFFPEFYGFVLPRGSPDMEAVDRAMLQIIEGPRWRKILRDYIGNHTEAATFHPVGSLIPK